MIPSSSFYQQREQQFKLEFDLLEKKIRMYAWSRVALVILAGILIYVGLSQSVFLWAAIVPVFIFVLLVRLQTSLEEKKQLANFLVELNQQELNNIQFKATKFPDGAHYADPHHPTANFRTSRAQIEEVVTYVD